MSDPHGGAYQTFPDDPGAFGMPQRDGSLKLLFEAAVKHAQDRIDWFDRKAGFCSIRAKRIRYWALILFSFGTVAPVLATLIQKIVDAYDPTKQEWLAHLPVTEIGYVFLAFAGALVVFDRFFDQSGSWIRYRQSQAQLEVFLARFRFSWARLMSEGGGSIPSDSYATADGLGAKCTALLLDFVNQVEALALNETNSWAAKFQSEIANFDSQLNGSKSKASEQQTTASTSGGDAGANNGNTGTPGAAKSATGQQSVSLKIFVANAATLDAGTIKLEIDKRDVPIDADGYAETDLAVDTTHLVVARAKRAGADVTGELTLTPNINQDGAAFAVTVP